MLLSLFLTVVAVLAILYGLFGRKWALNFTQITLSDDTEEGTVDIPKCPKIAENIFFGLRKISYLVFGAGMLLWAWKDTFYWYLTAPILIIGFLPIIKVALLCLVWRLMMTIGCFMLLLRNIFSALESHECDLGYSLDMIAIFGKK